MYHALCRQRVWLCAQERTPFLGHLVVLGFLGGFGAVLLAIDKTNRQRIAIDGLESLLILVGKVSAHAKVNTVMLMLPIVRWHALSLD